MTSQHSLSKILGSLSTSQIWAFFTATATAFTSIAGLAFWLGLKTAELSNEEKLSTLSAKLSKAETETLIQSERALQTSEKLKQYVEYASGLNSQIAQRDAKIASLNEQQEKANTCIYLQQQITALEQQISNISNGTRARGAVLFVYSGNKEEQQQREDRKKQLDDAELSQLQQRVIAHTQQLSSCTK